MTDAFALSSICDISLVQLQGEILDIAPDATPKRYRFLDCTSFIERRTLRICESDDLEAFPYVALSYVWRGSPVDPPPLAEDYVQSLKRPPRSALMRHAMLGPPIQDPAEIREHGFIRVKGAEDGDPISILVLMHACIASRQQGLEYLWLDRLCIIQSSKDDKHWQIRNMHDVYKSCSLCIVLPGGVQRIVPLSEETTWIHRAWTLQETLAPNRAMVLFRWNLGSGAVLTGYEHGDVIEVVPSESAMTDIATIVNACTAGELEFQEHPADWNNNGRRIACRILGSLAPNILALGVTLNETLRSDQDAIYNAIWQCALMRTSSRSVDMVLSIMGLFGVSLNPPSYRENERLRATVDLARAILQQGGRANWLGVSLKAPLSKKISTFPQFPQTSVAGKAFIKTKEGQLNEVQFMMDGSYMVSNDRDPPLPKGTMDASGYLSFSCRAAAAVQIITSPKNSEVEKVLISTFDNSQWELISQEWDGSDASFNSKTFAVILGIFIKYSPGVSEASNSHYRGMLVQEQDSGRSYVASYFVLDRKWRQWVMTLKERHFVVGGPNDLEE